MGNYGARPYETDTKQQTMPAWSGEFCLDAGKVAPTGGPSRLRAALEVALVEAAGIEPASRQDKG